MDSCMRDQPKADFESFCGNGILEGDEQCDCGPSDHCRQVQRCCDMSSCRLRVNATCGTGVCCDFDTCQPKLGSSETVCRRAGSECDFAELCDGLGEFCPPDVTAHDGVRCTVNNEPSFCFDGQCRSRQSQCSLLWGASAKVSNQTCFMKNLGGTVAANCGMLRQPNSKPDKYVKCALEDIYCGRLHCNYDESGLKFGWQGASKQLQIRMGESIYLNQLFKK